MSVTYRGIHWNRQKRIYDIGIALVLAVIVGGYIGGSVVLRPNITPETLILRGTALAGILLLHVVLVIGPLCRIHPVFLPLLYNRRHLGVAVFAFALVHAALSTIQFHALGEMFPLTNIFAAYAMEYTAVLEGVGAAVRFPFEPFGFIALVILFFMAATSHDFWLRTLGPSVWKTLHLLVYVAYGSVVVHVAYGALQYETHPLLAGFLVAGMIPVLGLHLLAWRKEAAIDADTVRTEEDGFVRVARVEDLDEGKGRIAVVASDRIALYLRDERVFALSNVCRHQAGPIGEGCLVDGLVTCPWHGWNYRIEDGVSPPPFHEVLETYRVRVRNGDIYVRPTPNTLESVCSGAPVSGGETAVTPPEAPSKDS